MGGVLLYYKAPVTQPIAKPAYTTYYHYDGNGNPRVFSDPQQDWEGIGLDAFGARTISGPYTLVLTQILEVTLYNSCALVV